MNINKSKTYRTACGLKVRILDTAVQSMYQVVASVLFLDGNERVYLYTAKGHPQPNTSASYALVEVTPYDHIKIDEPVYVWRGSKGIHARRGHFAGVDDKGYPLIYANGGTSWSTECVSAFDKCLNVKDYNTVFTMETTCDCF